MNQRTLTTDEKRKLFLLIAHGRGTLAIISRAFDIDRRTARQFVAIENLADIVPTAETFPVATWFALIDSKHHAWTTPDGVYHIEAEAAYSVRSDLEFLVDELIGDEVKARMVRELPPAFARRKKDLQRFLDKDFSAPEDIEREYHYEQAPFDIDENGHMIVHCDLGK